VAEGEGGPRNGVLTALEDFVDRRSDRRLATVPAFFGLGVVWHQDAPWAGAVAEILAPWDRNPLLARLEANRVLNLATRHAESARLHGEIEHLRRKIEKLEGEMGSLHARLAGQEELLRLMLDSRAIALADRVSSLRRPGAHSWRDRIRQVLGEKTSGRPG
jgi:hypothetical protein